MSILLGSLKLFGASVRFIENWFLSGCSEPYRWGNRIRCGLLLDHTLKLAWLDRCVGLRDRFLLLCSLELRLYMLTMLLFCEIDWCDTSRFFCATVCNFSCHLCIAHILAAFQIYSSSSTAHLWNMLRRIVAHCCTCFRALFFSQRRRSHYRIRLSWQVVWVRIFSLMQAFVMVAGCRWRHYTVAFVKSALSFKFTHQWLLHHLSCYAFVEVSTDWSHGHHSRGLSTLAPGANTGARSFEIGWRRLNTSFSTV